MVAHDDDDTKYEGETTLSNDAVMGRDLSTLTTRCLDNDTSLNDDNFTIVNEENDDRMNQRNDAGYTWSRAPPGTFIITNDVHPNIKSSYVGYGVDDVILYPAGGAYNKLRKKQQYLESLLKSHWYEYSQTSTNLKKEFVITNLLAPIYHSGRQFKIYNPNYRQTGEAEYTIPNVDIAFERMAQKLRDMKKSQTAEMYLNMANAGATGKGVKRKQLIMNQENVTGAGTTSTGSTTPLKKKRISKNDAVSLPENQVDIPVTGTTKAKKKGTPRPKKKTVATNCKKKAAVPRKRSTSAAAKPRAIRQRFPAASKMPAKTSRTIQETSIFQDNDQTKLKKSSGSIDSNQEEQTEMVLLGQGSTIDAIPIRQVKPTQLISSTSSLISNGSQERHHSSSACARRPEHRNNNTMNGKKNHELSLCYNNDTTNHPTNMLDGTTATFGVDEMKKYIVRVPLPIAIRRRIGTTVTNHQHHSSIANDATKDEEQIDFSDDDDDDDDDDYDGDGDYGPVGTIMNNAIISLSSTLDPRNQPKTSHTNRRPNASTTTTGTTNPSSSTSNSRSDDLSLHELKEIIWSQWEQIDCWRRLCRRYRETYLIQRDVIRQQDKLLSSSSSSKRTNIGGNHQLLSIPRLTFNKSNFSRGYSWSTANDDHIWVPIPTPPQLPIPSHGSTTTTATSHSIPLADQPTNDVNAALVMSQIDVDVVNEEETLEETKIAICEV